MPVVAELTAKVNADGVPETSSDLLELDAILRRLASGDFEAEVNVLTEEGQREVDDLQMALFDLDETTVTPAVELDVPRPEVEEIRKALQEFDNSVVTAEAEVDRTQFLATLEELRAALKTLADEKVTPDLDVGAALARLAVLEAALKAVPDEEVEVHVDRDRSAMDGLRSLAAMSSRAASQVNVLAMAIFLLGPALVPLTAVAAAGLGSLTAGFLAAAGGVGLFAAVAISAFSGVKDSLKAVEAAHKAYTLAATDKQREAALAKEKAALEALSPAERAVAEGYIAMKDAWDAMVKVFQPQIFQIAGFGLSFIADTIPRLIPLVSEMAAVFDGLQRRMVAALTGSFWASFFTTMATLAGPLTDNLLTAFGNIIMGIAGILNAFSPFALEVGQGFEDMTARFAEWGVALADNPGFQSFIQYVQDNLPDVMSLLGSLWSALINLVQAAAPIGTVLVDALRQVFDFITRLNQTNPNLLTMALVVAGLGLAFINLLGPIINVIGLFALIGPAIAGVSAATLGWVAVIIAAVIAVVAAVIYCWTNFEGFRNVIISVWNGIVSAAQAAWPVIVQAFNAIVAGAQVAWQWLVATFGPAVSAVISFVVEEFNKMSTWAQENAGLFIGAWEAVAPLLQAAWDIIVGIFNTAIDIIVNTWNALWPGLSTIVSGAWTVITGIISGAMDIIRGIIQVVLGVIQGDWSAVWSGLGSILSGIWSAISGIVMGALEMILGIIRLGLGAIRAVWDAGWAILENLLKPVIDAVIAVFEFLFNILVGNSIIPDLVNAVIRWFTQAASFLSSVFDGPRDLIIAVWNFIQAAIQRVLIFIVNLIVSTMARIISTITSTMQTARAVWDAAWGLISTTVSNAVSVIMGFISGLVSRIISAITDLGGRLFSAGKNIMNQLADGIRSGIDAAVSAARSAVDQVTNLLPGSPAKEGPLSGSGWSYTRGRHFSEDLAAGIDDGASRLDRLAAGLAFDLAGAVPAGAAGLAGGGGGVTVVVEAGAVAVTVGSGATAGEVTDSLNGAGTDLATAIADRLRRLL